MKKTIIFITAMLIAAAAFTGCNNSADGGNTSDKLGSSEQATEAPTKAEKEAIDPFENITYTISEESIYPKNFEITFDASDTPLGKITTFTYFVESANDKEIIVKSRANIDDELTSEFLTEYNFTVGENEKTFTINVEDLKTNFISECYISGDNKVKIISAMQNFIDSAFKISEDAEYENIFDGLGLESNNPDYIAREEQEKEEFEKEKAESQALIFELVELYAIIPATSEYEMDDKKVSSTIKSYTDDSSFEDVKIYKNKASFTSKKPNMYSAVMAIFKSNKNEFFSVRLTHPEFIGGDITEESLTSLELRDMFISGAWICGFDTIEEAYKCGTFNRESFDGTPDKYFGDAADTENKVVKISLS